MPFFLRTGKRLPVTQTEMRLVFRHAPRLPFIPSGRRRPEPSQLVIRVDPATGIRIVLDAHRADTSGAAAIDLDMEFANEGGAGDTPYEVLLHAALIGDASHFTRQDNVEECWRILQPLLDAPPRSSPTPRAHGDRPRPTSCWRASVAGGAPGSPSSDRRPRRGRSQNRFDSLPERTSGFVRVFVTHAVAHTPAKIPPRTEEDDDVCCANIQAWRVRRMLIDARSVEEGAQLTADLSIVGSGPAGLSIADRLRSSGLSVCVVEAGGSEPDLRTQQLYRGDITGRGYFALDSCRFRMFGGTSNRWGGWCRPLDPADFASPAGSSLPGWPIAPAELPVCRRRRLTCWRSPTTPSTGRLVAAGV